MAARPRIGVFRLCRRGILRYTPWERHAWLVHGFSTRSAGDFLEWPADSEVMAAFGAEGFGGAMLRQVHSCDAVCATRPWGQDRPSADAVLTGRPGVLVGVRTADCLPVLLVDPRTRAVAAVHAGWRGTVAGVLQRAFERMVSEFGSRPADVGAVIGPGIAGCCFEVGEEVACRFDNRFVDRARPRPYVDLPSVLESQMRVNGINRIAVARECTSCNLGRYFSHRAEKGQTGRMLSAVGVRAGNGR